MPLDERILGFSNRWYQAAMDSSETRSLSTDLKVRVVTSPYFVATKIEAFKGRGNGNFHGSHDLEDLVSVVDGRAELLTEVMAQPYDLRRYIQEEIGPLLASRGFLDALPGYLFPDAASQSRIGIVLQRLKALALPA
jgi:hypothetical protein